MAGGFDKQPPQDLAAEQSVLGGMMLSKDAIADVIEVLGPGDFYRPAHQAVYDCILDLYSRGEPADPVTVSAELERRGELGRVGGAVYLHTLIATVPTAANAGYYAEIVGEKAVLRRLVEAGTRIVQMGYNGAEGAEIDQVVDRAQAAIYEVTERRMSEDYVSLEDLLQPTMDEIDAIASRGGSSLGVPTGFVDLDEVTNGLHPGQMIIVAARPGVGKALALDTPLPTPTGWTTMGEVGVGDHLVGADGRPTVVIAATEIMSERPCYEVEFSDGTVIVADAEHQWATTTRAGRRQASETKQTPRWSAESIARVSVVLDVAQAAPGRMVTFQEIPPLVGAEFRNSPHPVVTAHGTATRQPRQVAGPKRGYLWSTPVSSQRRVITMPHDRLLLPMNATTTAVHGGVVTTRELHETMRCADGRANHAVAIAAAIDLPDRELLLSPYLLGVWLGDGHATAARFTTADPEIVDHLRADGFLVDRNGPMAYSIKLPESAPVAYRACVVCGARCQQQTGQVRTCGRACAARSRKLPAPPPTCPECGGRSAGGRRCQACHAHHRSVRALLRTLGVLGNKHIPAEYLRASEAQRRALLAGLLDTDGTVTVGGQAQFSVTSERLATDVQELIVSLGYRCAMTTKRVRGRTEASSTAYTLTFTAQDEVFRLERKRVAHAQRRRDRTGNRARSRDVVDVRPVASVPVRCVQVDAADHLYLASRSMIPTHNSTLGLDFVRSASVTHSMTSVIFSLEMSKTEIVMRMLSAEAKIRLADMRGGRMTDDDWTRLARRMSEISEAPLFVDDSPNMTMMEIRAKARRIKQRNDLKLVVVDYLQLMTSGKRVESRQQEVSEFSRQLKLLAKELEVPVVAISQLNRGPEQRTDKRPMLSDLRESGCLTAGTRVLRADNGTEATLGELLSSGEQPVVWSTDDRLRLVPRPMAKVFSSGVKEVFRLRLASGREVEATASHPFLTVDGWVSLGELAPGDRLAVPRQVPAPLRPEPMAEPEVVLLGHLIGDGSFVRRQPIRYTSSDEANLKAVTEAARHFGITAVRDDHVAARCSSLRLQLAHGELNPIAAWLDGLGLLGLRGHEKFVPSRVFSAPNEQIALFLRHLWATDGSVRWDEQAGQGRLHYASTSRRLVDDVAALLLRVGVLSRIKRVARSGYRDGWQLSVHGAENQLLFIRAVGVHGMRGVAAKVLAHRLEEMTGDTGLDTVPREVWHQVRGLLATQHMTHRELAAAMGSRLRGATTLKHAPSRSRLARVAAVLDDEDLEMLATNDISWDSVTDITSLGEQEVFDATVPGTHNFVANGISVHNSLEQDADMVLLIHRPDAWERDDPRAGEADLILAKHRAGPITTITVAHQLHYSRFSDLAQS
ncbi:MAG TPA: replicative DNA helicase [Pseudonocardiaceae bacterium]|jgi:replicative DNA helicase|nr:replicative DNA helicase [Pseudonocardiaceae bacterium]